MKLKKKLLLKKRKKHADKTSTVSTESCSHSSSPLSMSSPLLSPLSNVSSTAAHNTRVKAAAAVAAVDDGTPSHSALNDLHRVLKLIQDERHLIAYKLYMHAKERTILRHTTVTNNTNNNTTNAKSLSAAMDTSLASARSLLNSRQHEFHTLERRFDIFNAAKVNTAHEATNHNNNIDNNNNSNEWILAQTLFGITTYYRHESIDNSLSIKIEGELSDTTIPLFEQIVVLREADLYSTWAPFMTKSSKLAQIGTLDVVAHYEVRVPLLGLMRDACFRAVGCDCMKETGQVLLVAVGLNDSEEHGVKSSLNSGGSGVGERGGCPRGGGERGGEEAIVAESKIDEATVNVVGGGEQRRQSYAEQLTSATTDSNLVTDTAASTFLARDEILETIAIPPIPTGLGHGRMTIRNFAASIDVLGPSSARTCLVVNIDPNLHFLPQSLIDFTMKKMAGVMILKLQQAAKRVVSDPIKNPHARRMREDVSFYRDWLLPRFQRHCDEMGWDMPPVRALEVSEEALRAGGVFESWRSELDSGGGGGGGLSSSPSSTSLLDDDTVTECDDDEDGGGTGSLLSSQSSKSSRSKKFAKLVKQLRYPETPEEKIAAARARAARRLKPQPFSDSKKRRLRELKGVKRKTEDRIRANDESSCDGEGSVSTFGTSVQTFQRWDEDSGLKRSLVVFASTFLLNVLLPYFSSDKFLSSLSSSFKTQLTSVAKDSVLPLLFITLHAITLRALLDFVLIFAFDSIDFGQRKLVQNMESVRKLYYGEVRKYSSITAAGVVATSCGVAFLRFFLDEVALGMCSYFEKDWVTSFCDAASSKDASSCAQWALTISTFITTRLGIFVLALLLMASLVLPKPERRVRQKSTPKKKAFRSPHSLAASSRASTLNQQVESEAEETESGLSISSTSIGRDIPDTIGGMMSPSHSLSICGTFSPVGSMSMDVIDEEDEDIH